MNQALYAHMNNKRKKKRKKKKNGSGILHATNGPIRSIYSFIYLAAVGFELRASHLLGRHT
jgi:hypothetical protein